MAKSPSQVLLDAVVKEQVTSVLKPAGFKKKAMWFRREHGQTQQGINLQSSQGSTSEQKMFYVNVEVVFDEVTAHLDRFDVPKWRGNGKLARRLGKLVDDSPSRWSVQVDGVAPDPHSTTIDVAAETPSILSAHLQELLVILDALVDVETFCAHPLGSSDWFLERPLQMVAGYLTGDLDGAAVAIERHVAALQDRPKANPELKAPAFWVDCFHLDELRERFA